MDALGIDATHGEMSIMDSKHKTALKRELRIKEALYIRRYECGPYKGMNLDMGSYVTTTQWAPIFNGMSRNMDGEGPGSSLPSISDRDNCFLSYHYPLSLLLFSITLDLLAFVLGHFK